MSQHTQTKLVEVTMSKLFTEEQVRIMISDAGFKDYEDQPLYTEDYLIEQQIAIEIPTDEEIYELAEKNIIG